MLRFAVAVYWCSFFFFFFFKQKTAYEMRISDWSSDVCSSDLADLAVLRLELGRFAAHPVFQVAIQVLELVGHQVEAARQHAELVAGLDRQAGAELAEIGRASCRERVCQSV